MLRSFLLSCAVVAAPIAFTAACGSGDVALGSEADSQKQSGDASTGADVGTGTSNGGGGSDGGSDADGSTTLLECTMAANVEPLDASATNECTAARTLLICKTLDMGTSNAGEVCLSDDPTACPDPGGDLDASGYQCDNQCADDEYAVACGFGPGTPPTPPDGCHSGEAAPSGTIYYCCPCGG